MLDQLRKFFRRFKQPAAALVPDGKIWRCTKCNLLFLNEKEGNEHNCKEADAVR